MSKIMASSRIGALLYYARCVLLIIDPLGFIYNSQFILLNHLIHRFTEHLFAHISSVPWFIRTKWLWRRDGDVFIRNPTLCSVKQKPQTMSVCRTKSNTPILGGLFTHHLGFSPPPPVPEPRAGQPKFGFGSQLVRNEYEVSKLHSLKSCT